MDTLNLQPIRMHCPNCGTIVIGYKDDDGAVRILCKRCQVKIFSKQKTKKKVNIEVTFPAS